LIIYPSPVSAFAEGGSTTLAIPTMGGNIKYFLVNNQEKQLMQIE